MTQQQTERGGQGGGNMGGGRGGSGGGSGTGTGGENDIRRSVETVIQARNHINGVLPWNQIKSPEVLRDRLQALLSKPDQIQRLYDGFSRLGTVAQDLMRSEFAPAQGSDVATEFSRGSTEERAGR